jgi:hypothetical protein
MAATTWTVTVTYDAINGFRYKVAPSNQDCHYAANPLPPLDPPTFTVCANDTVQFVAVTPPPNSNELLVVIPDKILGDDTPILHRPTPHFHASDGKQTKGGIVKGMPDNTPHKYFLLVVVKDSGAIHCWDPKIIIGK